MYNITLYGVNEQYEPDNLGEVDEADITGDPDVVTFTNDVYGIYQTIVNEGEEIEGLGGYLSYNRKDRFEFAIELAEILLADYGTTLTSITELLAMKYHFLKTNTFEYTLQSDDKVVAAAVTGFEVETEGGKKYIKLTLRKVVPNG